MDTDTDTDRRLGQSISRWLEETAPPRLPDRVLADTFERTRATRQRMDWRARVGRLQMTHLGPALGAAAVVVVVAALTLNILGSPPRVGGPAVTADPRIPFLDTWVTTDSDGSAPTMTIRSAGEAALEIVVLDDFASVCAGESSTMTGTGGLRGDEQFVIAAPALTCDDGREPIALSGPPLAEQLRNLTFVRDARADILTDNFGGVWTRKGADAPRPRPTSQAFVWPQTSLAEVLEAQRRADAGDPDYTWQLDPGLASFFSEPSEETQIVARFLREVLGWEAFRADPSGDGTFGREGFRSVVFVRCAPGRTNPLYPTDPRGGDCAPTIDEFRYERVSLDLAQPVRLGESGIWVITRWEMIEPLHQAVPPSDAKARALLESFVAARIAGKGAERYVTVPDESAPSQEVPLLYATTAGAPYEQGQFDIVGGPAWPDGWESYTALVRLFADGDATVVEQWFWVERLDEGQLGLQYHYTRAEGAPTTENGVPVTVPYRFIPGEVRFRAGWPWYRDGGEPQSPRLITLVTGHDVPALYHARLAVVADPRPVGRRCQEGPPPANAEQLARTIQTDPDLVASAPVAVTVGGRPALRLDVEQAPGASLCDEWGQTLVLTAGLVDESSRMRLYLVDLPGTSIRTLAIALTAAKEDFERVMTGEAPLLDSFEFHAQ